MKNTSIYLIPGLGYDTRIFSKINWGKHIPKKLEWLKPEPKEDIKVYASRISKEINDDELNILIGHSFGGAMAQEIAAIKKVDLIILIASIKSRGEIPVFFRMVSPFKIYKLFTKGLSLKTVKYWGKDHGFVSNEEIELFKSMVGKQSNEYLQWALKNLSNWKKPATSSPSPIFHIHGKLDKTLPFKNIKNPDAVIEDGNHILLYKQPELIGNIIMEVIEEHLKVKQI